MNRPLRSPLRFLGAIRGSGHLSVDDGARDLGIVSFEIDSYSERGKSSANGRIDGSPESLTLAFDAGHALIRRESGNDLTIVLSDPAGAPHAEVRITAPLPVI
jgi:hypothetical protein